jgi:hypothetical protein
MSKIFATDSIDTGWHVDFIDLAPTWADLYIRFTNQAPVVEFKDLKFKYELRQNNNIIQTQTFPPSNTKYVRTDQPYLVVERFSLDIETEYELYLWAENDAKSFETTVFFTTPRPAQPYKSWTWDGEHWNPPVAHPDDSDNYNWDEESGSWILAEEKD